MEILILLFVGFLIYSFFSSSRVVVHKESSGKTVVENLKRRQSRSYLKMEKPDIEITPEIQNVLDIFENTSENVFLTGKAGTGKSTLLDYFRCTTKKNCAVVAPTGVAALNVSGQTIHSFFGFGIDVTLENVKYARAEKMILIRKLDALIIDEISMVRADLLDCIDQSLKMNRRNNLPFGGVQVILIGDPFQLPPVVKQGERKFFETVYKNPHFFSSTSYRKSSFKKLELTKIYRQENASFISILNSIRSGNVNEDKLEILNNKTAKNNSWEDSIKLVTTNDMAKAINNNELRKLPGNGITYTGSIVGNFDEKLIPTELQLLLKEGTKVMLLNNDKGKRWVNGDIGEVIKLGENFVTVKFTDNTFDDVEYHSWDNVKFVYNEEERRIEPEIVGSFKQIPLKLAWASTIHKSQGKTFDKVHIDFGTGTFAPGQAYVALSRCRTLEGLSFECPIVMQDILVDRDVQEFMGYVTELT